MEIHRARCELGATWLTAYTCLWVAESLAWADIAHSWMIWLRIPSSGCQSAIVNRALMKLGICFFKLRNMCLGLSVGDQPSTTRCSCLFQRPLQYVFQVLYKKELCPPPRETLLWTVSPPSVNSFFRAVPRVYLWMSVRSRRCKCVDLTANHVFS